MKSKSFRIYLFVFFVLGFAALFTSLGIKNNTAMSVNYLLGIKEIEIWKFFLISFGFGFVFPAFLYLFAFIKLRKKLGFLTRENLELNSKVTRLEESQAMAAAYHQGPPPQPVPAEAEIEEKESPQEEVQAEIISDEK